MESSQRSHRLIGMAVIALLAALMLGAFARMGGLGIEPRVAIANAATATEISSISVSGTCGSAGGFTGTVTLNGTFTGTVELGLFYHVPGSSTFTDSGLRADAVFSNSSTAIYNFASFTFPGANTYRIQVIDGAGLGGTTTKSNSVQPCTPGTTTSTTSSSSSTTKSSTSSSTSSSHSTTTTSSSSSSSSSSTVS